MDHALFWPVAVLASMLVGVSKGGLPVVGMLSVPVLSLVISPIAAAGLLLPVYVVSDMFGLYAYRREFNRKVVAIICLAATLGVGIGWATARIVPENMVTLLVGLIGASFALNLLWPRAVPAEAKPVRVLPGLFWGTIAGFTSFVSHTGGPPYQVYALPLRMSKTMFAGTSTVVFAYINAIKLVPYWALGQLSIGNLERAAVLFVPAVAAVFGGVWLVKVIPEKLFFTVISWALLLISLKLIWDGIG